MICTCKRRQVGPIYLRTYCWYHSIAKWLDGLLKLPPVERD